MKTRDKIEKKLKRRKWMNENKGRLGLLVTMPLFVLSAIFTFSNPFVALGCLCAALGVGLVGGMDILLRDQKNVEKEEELTTDFNVLANVTKETVVEIQKEIEQTKEKPLIKTLIRRKKLVEKELKEKEIAYSNGVNTIEIGLD